MQDLSPTQRAALRAIKDVLTHKPKPRLLFITGAGISTESGLPTYRGTGGLYHEANTEDELPIEKILSAHTMKENPQLSWKYLYQMETFLRGKTPNSAHKVLAQLEKRYYVVVLTQNIDGFHAAAGSQRVIEIHGNIYRLVCTAMQVETDIGLAKTQPARVRCQWEQVVGNYQDIPAPPALPKCPRCGGLVRPAVILFGEALPLKELSTLHEHLAIPFDIVFSIGTTSFFPYIQSPVLQARKDGKLTIEINPQKTILSTVFTHSLRTQAGSFLTALYEAI